MTTIEAPLPLTRTGAPRTRKFEQLSLLDQAEQLIKERKTDAAAVLMIKEYLAQRTQPRLETAPSPGAQLALGALADIYDRSRIARRELGKLADAGDQDVVDFIPQIKLARQAVADPAFVREAIAVGEIFRPAREARERAVAEQQRLAAETKRLAAWREAQAGLPGWMQDPAYRELMERSDRSRRW